MHYDKKIAVALGVLLVGVVAAFFFRREPDPRETAPQLADARSLDARIADKPIRPYESPAIVNTRRHRTRDAVRSASAQKEPSYDYDSGFTDPPGVRTVSKKSTGTATTLGPPEPIKPDSGDNDGTTFAQIPVPDHNAGWSPATAKKQSPRTPGAPAPRKTNRSVATSARIREYRVKPGDTLSGIAQRFLGRASRYREIYEANRKVMRNPNDIRPGIILRIPVRDGVEKRSASNPSNRDNKPFPRASGYVPPVEFTPPPGANNSPGGQPTTGHQRRARPLSNDRRFRAVRNSPFILDHKRHNVPKGTDTKSAPKPPKSSRPFAEPSSPTTRQPARVRNLDPPKQRVYVVKNGDSLERIAVRFYGTRRAMKRIVDANRGRIDRIDRLYPGTPLVLP